MCRRRTEKTKKKRTAVTVVTSHLVARFPLAHGHVSSAPAHASAPVPKCQQRKFLMEKNPKHSFTFPPPPPPQKLLSHVRSQPRPMLCPSNDLSSLSCRHRSQCPPPSPPSQPPPPTSAHLLRTRPDSLPFGGAAGVALVVILVRLPSAPPVLNLPWQLVAQLEP